MKKIYNSPIAEKVKFDYKDHVVASGNCWESILYVNNGTICVTNDAHPEKVSTWYDNKG